MTYTLAGTQVPPLSRPQASLQFVDPETGMLTQIGRSLLQEWRDFMSGTSRIIACIAAGTNDIVLTPVDTAPQIDAYRSFDVFTFVAANTSTGRVSVTVAPVQGSMPVLKAFVSDGAAEADSGDVVADGVYMAIFSWHLDGANGGFVLK